MRTVRIFLLFLINVNLSVSRTILARRNADTAKQINPMENDATSDINLAPTDLNKAITESTLTRLNIPSEIKYDSDVSRDSDVQKQSLRMGMEEMSDPSLRTTSEDTLRWLLKQHHPFPHPAPEHVGHLPKDVMLPVTEPLWRFEDYNDQQSFSKDVRDSNSDCEGQRINCVADTEYSQPVCVRDLTIPDSYNIAYRQKGFNSFCEVEYRNCLKRFEITGKSYADHYSEDYLEFLHYGWCEQCGHTVNC